MSKKNPLEEKYVASREIETDNIEVHARGFGAFDDHDTLCGMDIGKGNDEFELAELMDDARIDCQGCIGVVRAARNFTKKDVP